MRRRLAIAGAVGAYVCIGTVLALAGSAAYLISTGRLDQRRIEQIAAIVGGAELPVAAKLPPSGSQVPQEQASLEDLAEARALRMRDLELREQALANHLAIVKSEYDKLADEKGRYESIKAAFKAQLEELRGGTLAANRDSARLILESIKPKQAKEQVLRMVKDREIEDVVLILSQMPTAKRAKIIGEFKTEEEATTLAEILKLIRDGVPEVSLIDETNAQVGKPASEEP